MTTLLMKIKLMSGTILSIEIDPTIISSIYTLPCDNETPSFRHIHRIYDYVYNTVYSTLLKSPFVPNQLLNIRQLHLFPISLDTLDNPTYDLDEEQMQLEGQGQEKTKNLIYHIRANSLFGLIIRDVILTYDITVSDQPSFIDGESTSHDEFRSVWFEMHVQYDINDLVSDDYHIIILCSGQDDLSVPHCTTYIPHSVLRCIVNNIHFPYTRYLFKGKYAPEKRIYQHIDDALQFSLEDDTHFPSHLKERALRAWKEKMDNYY